MSLCWLCPGQGSQQAGMFARLSAMEGTAEALAGLLDRLDPSVWDSAADQSRCFLNRNAQPLIVLYGACVASALAARGATPDLVAGYSVGELTAHVVAGALPAADGLRLAAARAAAMDAAAPADHGMLAVRGLRLERISARAQAAGARIAIVNGADHAVLAGKNEALSALATSLAAEAGAHVVALPIGVPAHSVWLASATQAFREALVAADWRAGSATVLSALGAQPVYRRENAIETLSRELAEPLDWARTLDLALDMGASAFFEPGPGTGLTRMLRERHPEVPARAFDEFATLDGAVAWLDRHR